MAGGVESAVAKGRPPAAAGVVVELVDGGEHSEHTGLGQEAHDLRATYECMLTLYSSIYRSRN